MALANFWGKLCQPNKETCLGFTSDGQVHFCGVDGSSNRQISGFAYRASFLLFSSSSTTSLRLGAGSYTRLASPVNLLDTLIHHISHQLTLTLPISQGCCISLLISASVCCTGTRVRVRDSFKITACWRLFILSLIDTSCKLWIKGHG